MGKHKRRELSVEEKAALEHRDCQERMPEATAFWNHFFPDEPATFQLLADCVLPITAQPTRVQPHTEAEKRAAKLLGEFRFSREDALRALFEYLRRLVQGDGRPVRYSYRLGAEAADWPEHRTLERFLPQLESGEVTINMLANFVVGADAVGKTNANVIGAKWLKQYAFVSALRGKVIRPIALAERSAGGRGTLKRMPTQWQADVFAAVIRMLAQATDAITRDAIQKLREGAISAETMEALPDATPQPHDELLAAFCRARAAGRPIPDGHGVISGVLTLVMGEAT
jgi:hypothetical protein